MENKTLSDNIELQNSIDFSIENNILKVKGPKGEIKKKISSSRIKIKKENSKIILTVEGRSRKSKDILNSCISNLKNMLEGVNKSYIYKLKICSGHFPMNVVLEKDKVIIKNFLGEKLPRVAKILEDVNVKINDDTITVESIDKDKAGQVSANIEMATRIVYKDRRVFQDGIFLIEKAGDKK